MKVFLITEDCPAYETYKGSGKAVLVLYDNIPTQLIYLPEDATIENCEFDITKNIEANAEAYYGMASCYEFVAEKKLI